MDALTSRLVLKPAPSDYSVTADADGNIEIKVKKNPGIAFPVGNTLVNLNGAKFMIYFPTGAKPEFDTQGSFLLWLLFTPDLLNLGLLATSFPLVGKPKGSGKIEFTITNPGTGPITILKDTIIARGYLLSRLAVSVKT